MSNNLIFIYFRLILVLKDVSLVKQTKQETALIFAVYVFTVSHFMVYSYFKVVITFTQENECLTTGKFKTNSLCVSIIIVIILNHCKLYFYLILQMMQVELACLLGCEEIISIIEKDNDGILTIHSSVNNIFVIL